jgi:hypothetical protein
MRIKILVLGLIFIVGCGKPDNGRYVPYSDGVLDTKTGKIYQLQYKAELRELRDYIKGIDSVKVTDVINGKIYKYAVTEK